MPSLTWTSEVTQVVPGPLYATVFIKHVFIRRIHVTASRDAFRHQILSYCSVVKIKFLKGSCSLANNRADSG